MPFGLPRVSDILGSLFGAPTEEVPQAGMQSGAYRRFTMLGPETGAEAQLAGLQQLLARQAFQAGAEPLPGTLSLQNLAAGRLPTASMQRIREQAFGGLDVGLQEAARVAQERALARGVGLSSIQAVQEAQLQRPLLAQAGQQFAALQQAELGRLSGLRQQALANQLALQQSPALQRLLQLRLAQREQRGIQLGPEQLRMLPELTEALLGDIAPGVGGLLQKPGEEQGGLGGFIKGLIPL